MHRFLVYENTSRINASQNGRNTTILQKPQKLDISVYSFLFLNSNLFERQIIPMSLGFLDSRLYRNSKHIQILCDLFTTLVTGSADIEEKKIKNKK